MRKPRGEPAEFRQVVSLERHKDLYLRLCPEPVLQAAGMHFFMQPPEDNNDAGQTPAKRGKY